MSTEQRIARNLVQELQTCTNSLARRIDKPDGQDLLTLIRLALSVIGNIHDAYSKHTANLAALNEWLNVFDEEQEYRKAHNVQKGDTE